MTEYRAKTVTLETAGQIVTGEWVAAQLLPRLPGLDELGWQLCATLVPPHTLGGVLEIQLLYCSVETTEIKPSLAPEPDPKPPPETRAAAPEPPPRPIMTRMEHAVTALDHGVTVPAASGRILTDVGPGEVVALGSTGRVERRIVHHTTAHIGTFHGYPVHHGGTGGGRTSS